MAAVDNRVVGIDFDNGSFEKKVSTTIETLGRLEKSLAFDGAKTGLSELSTMGRGFNLSGMSSAVDGVSKSFLALSTVAITVLSNITTKAFDAGVGLVKSLSFDQIIGGFQEYETNMKSIQTILANTKADGTNLQDVNGALDELNEYADLTIYNFAEMARNIGTFTAAGVDLDTSTASIKGIANAAAISGSTSQQASTAMYQLSQAIASGSLKLMDWNSVVNAGMGGEVMQKALFDTGKAMGTLTGVDLDTTFDQWKDAGNTFRGSLQDGWVTTEVLTTALKGFSGEATDAELAAAGFSETMIKDFQELGETGIEAATKVRTFTQLMDTAQESVGSGWSQTFRIVLGDFEEATELFTGISDAFAGWSEASAEARNSMLQDWKDLGGRTELIEGLKTAFQALGEILSPIKEGFREIFPPATGKSLFEMTKRFSELAEKMRPSEATVANLKSIFTGFFAALEIGWVIVKEGVGFIADLMSEFTGAGSGGFLEFAASIGDFFTALNKGLVEGGGIKKFFQDLKEVIRDPLPFIDELKEKFLGFFENIDVKFPDLLASGFGRLEQRFEGLSGLAEKIGDIWGPFADAIGSITGILDDAWEEIKTWFSELGGKMSAAAQPGDFDGALDGLNVGILAAIGAVLAKLATGGIDLDFGNGLIEGITDTLDGLSDTLQAMQANIKATALLKIAGAVGILTASVAVLATIDSAALTKSLTAMSVGFGQLVVTFGIINKMALGPKSAAQFSILAGGLILLASAILVLSVAMKIMSTMSWGEIAKGLAGTTALLLALSLAAKPLSANSSGMIQAGIGILAISGAMIILAFAMKQMAKLSWGEMAKGLVGVAGGLVAIAVATQLMPDGMVAKGVGIIAIAVGLNILALAMKQFAGMSWKEMGKGLAGVAGGLVAMGLAMNLMPPNLPSTAVGLILVSASLLIIAEAMRQMAAMSWTEMAKGLVGMGAALLVLALATTAMTGALPGAIAIGVVAGALYLLAGVMQSLGSMSLSEIGKSLLAIAGVLVVLGLTSLILAPLIPVIAALGLSMLALGAGMALFGLGAGLAAAAFVSLAAAGKAGIGTLMFFIDELILRIPALIAAFAVGLVELGMVILEAAPVLIEQVGVIFIQLLQTIKDVLPQVATTMIALVDTILTVLIAKSPDIIAAGFKLLTDLLMGIRNNIADITTMVAEIIVEFLTALTAKLPEIIEAGWNLLKEFIKGIINHLPDVVEMVGELIVTFITELGALAGDILQAGWGVLTDFIDGIINNLSDIIDMVGEVITTFITGVGDLATDIASAGLDALTDFIGGITDNLANVVTAVGELISEFIGAVGDAASDIVMAGGEAIVDLIEGIESKASDIVTAGAEAVLSFLEGVASNTLAIANGAAEIIVDFVNGLATAIDNHAGPLRDAGWNLAVAIMDGITGGMASKAGEVAGKARDIAGDIAGEVGGWLGIGAPSKLMIHYGEMVDEGMIVGMGNKEGDVVSKAETVGQRTARAMEESLKTVAGALSGTEEFNPTITPVMDLTGLQKDAKSISKFLPDPDISIQSSTAQANAIASTETPNETQDTLTTPSPAEVRFEQVINAPTQLSTEEIYRQTRNQITLFKEELSIP